MLVRINHKRYIRAIPALRSIKRSFKVLYKVEYAEFIKYWDERVKNNLLGIGDLVSEEIRQKLLILRELACDHFSENFIAWSKNPKRYDNEPFRTKILSLINDQHVLLVDYRIENDMMRNNDLEERIMDLNDAKFLLSMNFYDGHHPDIRKYVHNSLQYFQNKKAYLPIKKLVAPDVLMPRKFSDLFEKPYRQPLYIDEFVRILQKVEPPLIGTDNEWLLEGGKAKRQTAAYFFFKEMTEQMIFKSDIPFTTAGKIFEKYFRGLKHFSIRDRKIADDVEDLYGESTGMNSIASRIKNVKNKIQHQII